MFIAKNSWRGRSVRLRYFQGSEPADDDRRFDYHVLRQEGDRMSIRAKLREGAAPYLQADEQIQAVFLAKRLNMPANDRSIVATDRRLLLFKLGFLGSTTGLLEETDRDWQLGPCSGLKQAIGVFSAELDVSRRFFKDVSEADRAAGF
jgi:hypothetical protein